MSIKSNDFDFGENLAMLISKKYKSVAAFSKATGINVKTLEGWCGKNSRFPSRAEYIKKMADALDVSVHELMFGEPDMRDNIATIFEKNEVFSGVFEISIKKVTPK